MGNFFNLNINIMKEQNEFLLQRIEALEREVERLKQDNKRMSRAFEIVVKEYEVL